MTGNATDLVLPLKFRVPITVPVALVVVVGILISTLFILNKILGFLTQSKNVDPHRSLFNIELPASTEEADMETVPDSTLPSFENFTSYLMLLKVPTCSLPGPYPVKLNFALSIPFANELEPFGVVDDFMILVLPNIISPNVVPLVCFESVIAAPGRKDGGLVAITLKRIKITIIIAIKMTSIFFMKIF